MLAADAVPYVLLELYGDRSSATVGKAADGREGNGAARPTKKQKLAMKVGRVSVRKRMGHHCSWPGSGTKSS